MSTVADSCTVRDRDSQESWFFLGITIITVILGFTIIGLVNVFAIDLLTETNLFSLYLEEPGEASRILSTHAWVAGITEPFTSKLLPAVLAVWVLRQRHSTTCVDFKRNRLVYGFMIGITFGVTEIAVKMMVNPNITGVSAPILLPLILHTVNGLIIAGTYFSVVGEDNRSRFVAVAAAIIVAAGLHITWNTWFVQQEHIIQMWVDLLSPLFES